MNFNDYQNAAAKTATYPNVGNNYIYPVLGLNGEAGEVAEKIKKVIRQEDGIISKERKQELAKELGDVLWYVAQMVTELGLSLDDVVQMNVDKLASRQERGVLHSSGDNR